MTQNRWGTLNKDFIKAVFHKIPVFFEGWLPLVTESVPEMNIGLLHLKRISASYKVKIVLHGKTKKAFGCRILWDFCWKGSNFPIVEPKRPTHTHKNTHKQTKTHTSYEAEYII